MVVPRLCLTMPTVERNVVVDQPSTSARPRFDRQINAVLAAPRPHSSFLDGDLDLLGINPEAPASIAAPLVGDVDIPTSNECLGRRVIDL
jgi:hypothetical protein